MKRTSPRSVLESLNILRPSPRTADEVLQYQAYAKLNDEDDQPWYGSHIDMNIGVDAKNKSAVKKAPHISSKAREEVFPEDPEDFWLIEKVKSLSLKVTIDKVTNSEDYTKPKDKHTEGIIQKVKKPNAALEICKRLDHILKKCSKGSLTFTDDAVRILKVCYVLHNIMKKGTSETYKNTIGHYPDIFDLPQIALPKGVPAPHVEARMAICYMTFLNTRVRLRQNESLTGSKDVKDQIYRMHGMKEVTVMDLYDQGLQCRFFRKCDTSPYVIRDTIHVFQLLIISDMLDIVEKYESAFLEKWGNDPNVLKRLGKKKRLLVNWAERMQGKKFLEEVQYYKLRAVSKAVLISET